MRAIVERGDFIEVDGEIYLLAPVDAATIDALAAFETEGEDIHPDNEADGLPFEDREPDEDAGEGVGCPPAIVARKRAIMRARPEPRPALDSGGRPGMWLPLATRPVA